MSMTVPNTNTEAARLGPTRYFVVVATGVPYPAG